MPANFGSDNSSGVHPSIIEALVQASVGAAPAYGADALLKGWKRDWRLCLSVRWWLYC